MLLISYILIEHIVLHKAREDYRLDDKYKDESSSPASNDSDLCRHHHIVTLSRATNLIHRSVEADESP
jgi:hypothetical protein